MKGHINRCALTVLLAGTATLAVACSKEPQPKAADTARRDQAPGAEGGATGKVIVVEAYSDEKGSYFKPSEIEAHRGDIIRYTLKSGVHNVHFLPDSNPGKTGLPPASDMLQLPDQTFDVKVSLAKGRYFFQCDPHVALGMKGHVTVED